MKYQTDTQSRFLFPLILRLSKIFTLVMVALLAACTGGSPNVSDADRNEVITLGDSIFDLSGKLQKNLEAVAGETFRDYTQSGGELEGGFLAPSVYEQYQQAKLDDAAIDIVVMNGGGNDILIPVIALDPYDCKTQWWEFGRLSKKCKNFLNDIYIDAVNLLNDMYADGVDNVIYLGYYYTKNGLLGNLSTLEEAVDYGDLIIAAACENSVVQCDYVDPRSVIKNGDIIFDGVHPAASGSEKLANLIWPRLSPLL